MDLLRKIALQNTPRIIGFTDRKENSKTYGCCDRYYWHYKLLDVSNGRFQEACLLFALLYSTKMDDNIYYKNKKVLQWIFAIIQYWLNKMNHDGSVSEVYPFERSFCATSFSTYSITETILILKNMNENTAALCERFIIDSEIEKKLVKTKKWITKNIHFDLANQLAAALLAIKNISLIFNHNDALALENKITNFFNIEFEKYGFLKEYDGFDIGYSSITNGLLLKYLEKSNHQKIRHIINNINDKILPKLDQNGNYNSSYNSRYTQFLYLYGFTEYNMEAIYKVTNGIKTNQVITPLWLDDRYSIAMTIDYLMTFNKLNHSL